MIAIIGAGIAGLTAARTLQGAGHAVRVVEKSRGLGGRIATRRGPHGAFDHGAQYASVRDADFAAYCAEAAGADACADWRFGDDDARRVVGLPGMSGLVKPLAEGIDVERERRVTRIVRDGEAFHLEMEGGAMLGPFSHVISAVPAPQAVPLLAEHGAPFDALKGVDIAPCWTLMLAFAAAPALPPVKRFDGTGTLGWIARDSAKPGRDDGSERWVVHAAPDWSRAHLEDAADAVRGALLTALGDEAGAALPEVTHAATHRWRYAQVMEPLGQPFLLAPDGRLGACGDACLGGRVEAAYLSGLRLGRTMAERLQGR